MGSRVDIATRVTFLIGLLLSGKTTKECRALWTAQYGLTSDNTWYSDLEKAYEEVSQANRQFIEHSKDLFLARYDALYEKALEKDDLKTAADVTNKSVKLLGLEQEKVEVTTPENVTIEFK